MLLEKDFHTQRNMLQWKYSLRKPSVMNKVLTVLKLFPSRKFFVILNSIWYDKTV